MDRFACFVGLTILTAFIALGGAQLDFSATQASSGTQHAAHPSIGVSEDGYIMVVWWHGMDESGTRVHARVYTPGVGWGGIMEIPGQEGASAWPRVKGGAGSEFHVVWSEGKTEHWDNIKYSHYRRGSFSTAQIIQYGDGAWPDLCYNLKNDVLSVAWESAAAGEFGEIVVRQRVRGAWGGKANASKTSYWAGRVRITTDDAGNLYATWQQKTQLHEQGREIFEAFYNRTVNGAWQNSINISNFKDMCVLPNLAVNPSGTEVFVQWFNLANRFHTGLAIGYSGSSPNYGTIHRIGRGHYRNLHYYTGMIYHGNALYISYVDDAQDLWLKNFQGGESWGAGGTMPRANCPLTPDLAESPNLGLALAWYNRCDSPNNVFMAYGQGFGDSPTPPPAPKPNVPPTARIILSPSSGIYPLRVSFDGTSSSDPDGQIVKYAWTLGDGNTSTQSKFNHTYQNKGSYTIQLTVTDDRGGTSTASAIVTVYGVKPPLNIAYSHHQNRNIFSTEHYFRVRWDNNPVNEQRGFNIVRYIIYRRVKGQGEWQYLIRIPRKDNNEYLDRSLKNEFRDFEYTVVCEDIEGRQSSLPNSESFHLTPVEITTSGLPSPTTRLNSQDSMD